MHMCPNCGVSLKSFEPLTYGNVHIEETGDVVYRGVTIPLTKLQADIAIALIRARGRPLTRQALITAVGNDEIYERSIDTYVRRVRHVFEQHFPDFNQIKTRRSVGYLWERREAEAKLTLVA